ncbi:MAG: Rrf2 family transcriptional regulator [Pyrinomonadaceae bacterium]
MASNSQFAVAIHILAMLAKNGDQKVKSECIAESVNTNAVVIRRLLCSLQEADLVVSQKGASGGTLLAKKVEEINLNDVYQAVSTGEVFSLHRQKPSQDCPVGKNIESVLCHLQKNIDRAIEEQLVRYTLADVIRAIESGKGKLG